MRKLNLLLAMAMTFASTLSLAAEVQENRIKTLVDADLYQVQDLETNRKSGPSTETQNKAELENLLNLPSPRTVVTSLGVKANSIDLSAAEAVMLSMDRHPVVSYWGDRSYQQTGAEIGFCFGRATYAHLMLIKMGVNEESIKKIWAVGPMAAGGLTWGFHVATIVRSNDGGWYVIDNYPGKILQVTDWMEIFKAQNKEKNLRFYFTNPEKFSVSLGKYSRVQMGLDLTKNTDWYKNYFKDLMKSLQPADAVQKMGLMDLRIPVTSNSSL